MVSNFIEMRQKKVHPGAPKAFTERVWETEPIEAVTHI